MRKKARGGGRKVFEKHEKSNRRARARKEKKISEKALLKKRTEEG